MSADRCDELNEALATLEAHRAEAEIATREAIADPNETTLQRVKDAVVRYNAASDAYTALLVASATPRRTDRSLS